MERKVRMERDAGPGGREQLQGLVPRKCHLLKEGHETKA